MSTNNYTFNENLKVYDYLAHETNDVIDYINENLDLKTIKKMCTNNQQDMIDSLVNVLDSEDDITGNGSGSFTFSTLTAERYLYGNWNLLQEAIEAISPDDENILKFSPEKCDVMIRTYLLSDAVSKALDKLLNNQTNKQN